MSEVQGCELIRVDFRQGREIGRVQLDKQKEKWVASKDPDFKGFLSNIAYVAEMMVNEFGGRWQRMTVVVADPEVGEDGTVLTLWDQDQIDDQGVKLNLSMALLRLEHPDAEIVAEESRDVDPS